MHNLGHTHMRDHVHIGNSSMFMTMSETLWHHSSVQSTGLQSIWVATLEHTLALPADQLQVLHCEL